MTLDQALSSLIYLAAAFLLFLVGKLVYDRLRSGFSLKEELFQRDNVAMAVAVAGYYLGLVLALGGVLSGPSEGLVEDLVDIGLFGLLTVVLLNVSDWLNGVIVFRRFDRRKEIVEDRNAGTGALEAGNHIANGLILAGALSGEGGGVDTALAFWAMGQVVLAVAGKVYTAAVGYDLHGEIERDNVPVGVAFAGALVGLGNVVREAASGDFVSWQSSLQGFALLAGMGLVLLPLVRLVTDLVLVPGASLKHEMVGQETPNLGAGLIEATAYVAASFLIIWAI